MVLPVLWGAGTVTRPGGIASADRAFLKVSLEDIAPTKRIAAENARIWAFASV
jgi:hypothetical protein